MVIIIWLMMVFLIILDALGNLLKDIFGLLTRKFMWTCGHVGVCLNGKPPLFGHLIFDKNHIYYHIIIYYIILYYHILILID